VLRAHTSLDELRSLSSNLRIPPRERAFIDNYLEAAVIHRELRFGHQ